MRTQYRLIRGDASQTLTTGPKTSCAPCLRSWGSAEGGGEGVEVKGGGDAERCAVLSGRVETICDYIMWLGVDS